MRTLRVVWAAMVGSVLTYTALIYALMITGTIDLSALDAMIMNYVGGAIVVYMFAGVYVRRALIERIPRDAPPETRLARYTSASIVGFALAESGGLTVITLALISGAPTWALAGGLATVVLLVMARPSAADLS